MYSYLHNKSGDTQYTDRARCIGFDEFSALRHGDVVIVHTFVLCVMSCKSRDYVGTMKNYYVYLRLINQKGTLFDLAGAKFQTGQTA
jgi:hypothetical protein